MAYDERLAERIRARMQGERGYAEKKMFGGIAFLLDGNMCCGIVRDDLMARVGPEAHEQVLREPHARAMDFVGRPMVGMVFVGPEGIATDAQLDRWVERCVRFVRTLPPKAPKTAKAVSAGKTAASRTKKAASPKRR